MITSPNVIATPTWPSAPRLRVDHDRAAPRRRRARTCRSARRPARAPSARLHQQQPALAAGLDHRQPLLVAAAVVLTALTIAPCIPSATSCVNSTETLARSRRPRARPRTRSSRARRRCSRRSEPRSAALGGRESSSATTSLTPIRPPGLSTRAISVSTAGLSVERLITQFEMTTSTDVRRQRDLLDHALEEDARSSTPASRAFRCASASISSVMSSP